VAVLVCVGLWRTKQKAPPIQSAGLRETRFVSKSVSQFDRPAEAGVVVPVVVRAAEHLP